MVLFALSIAFRLPTLINAAGTNSDAAVVGLQAMHLLRGEWSPFLWGSGYQTSADAIVAAFFFLFTGPSALALTASTLAGHIVLTWLSFDLLRKHLPAWTAAAVSALLVFTPDPVHTYVLYPPRQASLTLVFLAFWLTQGASGSKRPIAMGPQAAPNPAPPSSALIARLAAGGAVATFAVWADPYALLFLPAQALLAALVLADLRRDHDGAASGPKPRASFVGADRPELVRRAGAFVAGAAVGIIPYQLLIRHPLASRGQTSLTLDALDRNLKLLFDPCGPWLLSTKVYAAKHMSDYQPWDAGGGLHALQLAGAAVFVLAVASGAALVFVKRIPWELRRLGLVGAFMAPVTIGGFLVSPMVMDHFSSRYLAAIILAAPFAVAPLAWLLQGKRVALALAPYLISGAISGWVSYRPFTLARHPSLGVDAHLGAVLRERGIRYAVADYWASYRLTLAWAEQPIVVPKNEGEDRYRPYRKDFEAAEVVAYIFDAYRSRENLDEVEAKIKKGETAFEPRYDRFVEGNFTVLILRRAEQVRVVTR